MTITFSLGQASDLEMDQRVTISVQESSIMIVLPPGGAGSPHHVLTPIVTLPALSEEEPTWEDAEWQ